MLFRSQREGDDQPRAGRHVGHQGATGLAERHEDPTGVFDEALLDGERDLDVLGSEALLGERAVRRALLLDAAELAVVLAEDGGEILVERLGDDAAQLLPAIGRHRLLLSLLAPLTSLGVGDRLLLVALLLGEVSLQPKDRDILMRYFGLEGAPETLQAIGESYGHSRDAIRQRREKTLAILAAAARGRLRESFEAGGYLRAI